MRRNVVGVCLIFLGIWNGVRFANGRVPASFDALLYLRYVLSGLSTPISILSIVVGAILLTSYMIAQQRKRSEAADHAPSASAAHEPIRGLVRWLVAAVLAALLLGVVVGSRKSLPAAPADSATVPPAATPAIKPDALNGWEVMKDESLADSNGFGPAAKKRMREMFVLQFNGAMLEQNYPARAAIAGEEHEVIEISWKEMTEPVADSLIRIFRSNDANFWNGARFMDFQKVVFAGIHYRRVISRAEIDSYSKNYESYRQQVIKNAAALGAEVTKPAEQSR